MNTDKDISAKITSYKGFCVNFQCRGFQYEVGKTYEHEGDVKACSSGFHACEYPLDVFGYYSPADSKFAEVEQEGDLSRHNDDSKVASKKITIKAELSIAGLIKAAIDYTHSRCDQTKSSHSKGNAKASSATGYRSASSATGDRSASLTTGSYSSSEINQTAENKSPHSVAISLGHKSKSKAPTGSAIVCVYRNDNNELIHIKSSKVGDNGIKPDVWYTLDSDGEFIEVKESV